MIATTAMDPCKPLIWAGIERAIKDGQMAGLQKCGFFHLMALSLRRLRVNIEA
ncbi:MAG: hypothetical protein M0T85_14350 [Dehalococcoidales bacterium]|nr:hypothetical protein [Dehalococcoidales bacterium]